MSDAYERSAEYLDLLVAESWESTGPAVAAALSGGRATTGTVLDLGAGSGRGVRVICAALPQAPVVAVEPSAPLRAVLLARVFDDPALRGRVTVFPGDCASVDWPDGVRAVVALNMIGHLPPAERRELWATAARQLAPGGRLVLNLAPPYAAVEVERSPMAGVTVGELEYLGSAAARPTGPDELTWQLEYAVRRAGGTIARTTVEYRYQIVAPGTLTAEAAAAGLTCSPSGDPALGLYVLERPA